MKYSRNEDVSSSGLVSVIFPSVVITLSVGRNARPMTSRTMLRNGSFSRNFFINPIELILRTTAWVKWKKHPLIDVVWSDSWTAEIQPLSKSEVIFFGENSSPLFCARFFSASMRFM